MARERLLARGVRLRPEVKTHKCAVITLCQISLGAVGVCCQNVSEAEALVRKCVGEALITNEVIGRRKLAKRLKVEDSYRRARTSKNIGRSRSSASSGLTAIW
jgi:D-serine deaminase-like pyridoxal phosphate-dependent protein